MEVNVVKEITSLIKIAFEVKVPAGRMGEFK
jgi:hypothetical protein